MTATLPRIEQAFPTVRDSVDRNSLFPFPVPGMKVWNLSTKSMQRYDASLGWVDDFFFGPTYDVRRFGATGDGVTDDTLAVAAAIDACEDAGGGTVRFPKGTYKITSALAVPAHTSLRGEGPYKTRIVKAFNGTLFTVTGAGHVEFHDFALDGNYPTNTGKGIVITGSTRRPVIQNIWSFNFSGTHLEFGPDAGEFAWVDGYNTYPEASQTDYKAIEVAGPDTGARFRRFSGVQCTLGYISLLGAADTQFTCSSFRRVETDAACAIVSIVGCVWGNLSAAMTLNGTTMDVHACRMSGDVTLSSSFTGSFIGNTQTAGTFTDNTTAGNALVYHHPLATNYAKLGKHYYIPQIATGSESVLTDRTATTGDQDITQTPAQSAPTRLFTTTMTADRTVTLTATGAIAGLTYTFVHTAGGGFKVDVGGLVNLWQNQWCVVRYTGAAFVLVAFGRLGRRENWAAKTAAYTVLDGDDGLFLGGTTWTLTLQSAATRLRPLRLRCTASGTITIARAGSDTIEGATASLTMVAGEKITLMPNGTDWLLV